LLVSFWLDGQWGILSDVLIQSNLGTDTVLGTNSESDDAIIRDYNVQTDVNNEYVTEINHNVERDTDTKDEMHGFM
jgi:hypothetical protein